jgi:PAS domain S-box-containing protein
MQELLLAPEAFQQQLAAAYHRCDALLQQVVYAQPPEQWRSHLLEEFQCLIEELRSSAEEIRVQKQQLQETNRIAKRERRRYRDLFDFAPDAYLVTDPHGSIGEANEAAQSLLGVTPRYLCDLSLITCVVDRERPRFRQALELLRTQARIEDWELWMRSPKREPFPAVVTVGRVAGESEEPALHWLIRDVSERTQRDEESVRHAAELAHLGRLSVMGEMAAGLAHELNQPLAAIANYARGCMRRLNDSKAEPADLLPILADINAQAERGGAIIQRMRDFTQCRAMTLAPVDCHELVHETVALAQADIRASGTSIQLNVQPELPPVWVDRIQIEQVLLNLVRNALDAMAHQDPQTRRLTIDVEPLTLRSVQFSVSDTGPGLSPAAQGRLFEPFFTTKPSGMGMGLAICRTVLQAQGQRIWVTPAKPQGTSFCFTLPTERGGGDK